MAENKITLNIVTPSKELYNAPVDMVVMRTTSGDVGILHGHQPMVTVLDYGVLKIKISDTEELNATVFGGFAQISPDNISILSDAAEWPDEIDVERAIEAKERAEMRLKESTNGIDTLRAEMALKRALIRIEVGKK